MKLVRTASGKKQLKMSKKEWTSIGKKAGWMKKKAGLYGWEKAQENSMAFLKNICKENGIPIWFGTAVGKAPQTVILDMTHQGGEVSVSANGSFSIDKQAFPNDSDSELDYGVESNFEIDADFVAEWIQEHKAEITAALLSAGKKEKPILGNPSEPFAPDASM